VHDEEEPIEHRSARMPATDCDRDAAALGMPSSRRRAALVVQQPFGLLLDLKSRG
jgi:hypothetical protein